jgi:hypothetical protein
MSALMLLIALAFIVLVIATVVLTFADTHHGPRVRPG